MLNQNQVKIRYKPINQKQDAFHKSKVRHKLLIGGVGAGKTIPACHEAFFIAMDNPGHEFAVFRNTWESLEANVQEDMIKIAEINDLMSKPFDKQRHDMYLKNGTKIMFRPLGMKIEQIKGMHLCGFFVDDPDVWRFRNVIMWLYTRLRNPPGVYARYFRSIICANWEGKDWLWQRYMRGKKEGENIDNYAHWLMRTQDNPTLPPHYIEDLAGMYNEDWMNRYVYCDLEHTNSGLVYHEYDPKIHNADLSWLRDKKKKKMGLIKVLVVDVGLGTSVILKMATEGKNIYIYDEWYRKQAKLLDLGEYLYNESKKNHYRDIIIDPSSAQKEQTSGSSMKEELKKGWHLHLVDGTNAIDYGISVIKDLLTIREGVTHFFIDIAYCPKTAREIEIYRYKEKANSAFDDVSYKEKPVDVDDHCMDCAKYGTVYLKKYLKNYGEKLKILKQKRKEIWNKRLRELRYYKENPKARERRMSPTLRRLKAIHYGRK
jgi:glycosyltransferase involved in cell wall biosynthesis